MVRDFTGDIRARPACDRWSCLTKQSLRAETLDIPVRPHGDCEYCVGGSGHHLVRSAAEALKSGEKDRIAAIPYEPSQPAAAGCGTGSCGSCSITSAVAR